MEALDREVLEFIGDQGKTAEQVSARFPAFDLESFVRAELARPRRSNPVTTQSRHTQSACWKRAYATFVACRDRSI